MSIRIPKRSVLSVLAALVVIIGCTAAFPSVCERYMRIIYPIRYSGSVLAAAAEFDLPPSLIYAVIHTESHFDADALSPANAKGLMQLTDDTFRWALQRAKEDEEYTTEDLFNPFVNIRYGAYVLSLLREQFEVTDTSLAAYNAGAGRVNEWLKDPACSTDGKQLTNIPYKETRQYVRRVRLAQKRYQQLYDIV